MIFFMACDCVKCLVLKGLAACREQIEKSFRGKCEILSTIHNPSLRFSSVASNKATNQR